MDLGTMIKEGRVEERVVLLDEEGQSQGTTSYDHGDHFIFPLVSWITWVHKYAKELPNIYIPTIKIDGVDQKRQLLLLHDHGNHRRLVLFNRCERLVMLDLKPTKIDIYPTGTRIIFDIPDDFGLRCFMVRTSLWCILCHFVENTYVPFTSTRIRKRDKQLVFPKVGNDKVLELLQKPIDRDKVEGLYPPAAQCKGKTYYDLACWMNAKADRVKDIVHHQRLEKAMLKIFSVTDDV